MSLTGSSVTSHRASSDRKSPEAERQEWIYRGVAGFVAVLLLWLLYRNRYDGGALLSLPPLIIGAVIVALRLPASDRREQAGHLLAGGSEDRSYRS